MIPAFSHFVAGVPTHIFRPLKAPNGGGIVVNVTRSAVQICLTRIESGRGAAQDVCAESFEGQEIGNAFFWIIGSDPEDDRNRAFRIRDEASKVNINTAPRHVLAAAFTFGGDAFEIAEAIVEQRKVEPFKTINDFRDKNYGYSDSIKRSEPYITTQSTFFAIEIKAECGNAIATSIATFNIKGGKAEKIGIMSDI